MSEEDCISALYPTEDGRTFEARVYLPAASGTRAAERHPVIVAVHGGGWQRANLAYYRHWGPWLSARGYAVVAITHRLTANGESAFPGAVHDVRSAIDFVRLRAQAWRIDSDRIALMGDSSGAHLCCLAALADSRFPAARWAQRQEWKPLAVKAVIAVYGVYDLAQQWRHDQIARPRDHITEKLLGVGLPDDRFAYFQGSPLAYVSAANSGTAFLLAWGDADDVVDCDQQSVVFQEALKQSGHFVRSAAVPGAAHFWIGDPLDEPGSASGWLAPRLLRFLAARL
ncbi:MAG: alpha/beta hydrolase fold domain-containing protein [Lautropia sp.]